MKDFKLTILETSDIHGHIYPIDYGTNEYQPLGLAKIATYIKQVRADEPHTLFIDNGDNLQGTPLTYHYVRHQHFLPNPVSQTLNELGYDAAAIGNHEFNYGMDILNQAAAEASFPWLAANILNRKSNEPHFGTPYLIKTFEEGLKVAVLGLTTHFIPNWEKPEHIQELVFEDALQSAQKWVSHIRSVEKPDFLIVTYHGGFEKHPETGTPTENLTGENQGYELCHQIDGIDVLLTGHQHRLLAGEVNGVTIVQPGCNGATIGRVDVHFQQTDEHTWVCKSKQPSLISVEPYEADETLLSMNQLYEDATQVWLDRPIGHIAGGDMIITDPFAARLEEHPLVEFINRVQMDAANVDISNTALFHNQVRGLPAEVTMREIVSNYVYPNTLTILEVTGQDIKDALERSASYFIVDENGEINVNPSFYDPKPQHYNYDMWEGIDYTIDVSRPVGERIVSLMKDGEPLSKTHLYQVVMNNYRATGGGDYPMFKGKKVIKEIQMDMTEIIANYFSENELIQAEVNHNWKVIKGCLEN